MKNKFLLSILTVFLLTVAFVSAADGVTFITTSIVDTVAVGSAVTATFNISNSGDTDNSVVFSDYDLMQGTKKLTINYINPVFMAAGETKLVTLSIPVSSNQFAGVYTGNLKATLGTATATLPITITVNATAPSVTLTEVNANGVAGATITATSKLKNTANIDISIVNLVASDLTSGSNTLSIQLSPSSTSLDYGDEKTITLTVTPSPSQAPGTYNSTLMAVLPGVQEPVVANVYFTVTAPQPSLTVSSPPTVIWAKGLTNSLEAKATVQNTGNTNLTSLVIRVDAIDGATISLNPSGFNLATGGSQEVTLTITGISESQASGTYSGKINVSNTLTSAAGTLTIDVKTPVHSISVPDKISFGSGQRNSTVSTTVRLTNNGQYTLTDITINSSLAAKYNSQLSASFIDSLAPGDYRDITFTATVPADKNSQEETIGYLYVTAQDIDQKQAPVTMSAESELGFYRVKASVAGSGYQDISNGELISDEAKPGDTVDFRITVHNLYSTSEDIKIEDIQVTLTADDLESDDEDMDWDSSEFSLKANKKKEVSFNFNVPEDADEGDYSITIEVVGEDENGAEHYLKWETTLQVEKKDHDLMIDKFEFSPDNVVECGETIATLKMRISNKGSSYEDEVVTFINNSALNINLVDRFELDNDVDDEDSEFEKTYSVLVPRSTPAGTYLFSLWVYYDEDIPFDYTTTNLIVNGCGAQQPQQPEQPQQPQQPQQPDVPIIIPQPAETPAFNQPAVYLAVLVIASLAVLGAIIAVIVKIMSMPK